MANRSFDIAIIGGGMVGLCIAHQLIKRDITKSITIIDKESMLGKHSSGRNSGVLHAGLYYKPGSVRARVCVNGAKRLREWVLERKLSLNSCGKVVVPPKGELDEQLDVLYKRGYENGAVVEMWDEQQLRQLIPEARSCSGRALWSPNTAVVKPIEVLQQLQKELEVSGVRFITGQRGWNVKPSQRRLVMDNGDTIAYGHLINCTGLQADRVAYPFGVGHEYILLPFKGLYWQLKNSSLIQPKANLYPVPDLNVPFLGVHFTPSADPTPVVSIGPTATPAWGRENYQGASGLELGMALSNIAVLAKQYLANQGGFRRYVHEQAFLALPPLLLRATQQLIPAITANDLEPSKKVGIRSQLFNVKTEKLENDFLCLPGPASTHVMNAISPAFTASFALADLIIDEASLHITSS
jgi:L-2-hydroxyglutarate oxidase